MGKQSFLNADKRELLVAGDGTPELAHKIIKWIRDAANGSGAERQQGCRRGPVRVIGE
jgi:hypothetical protein